MPDSYATGLDAPASPLDAATILEDAADLLLIHGRCRGVGIDGEGRMCVRGAIRKAQGLDPAEVMGTTSPAQKDLERHLADHPDIHAAAYIANPANVAFRDSWLETLIVQRRWPSWMWNDDPATTDDEVRDVLLLTAKDLRNEATA
jgi:hypothetical protein